MKATSLGAIGTAADVARVRGARLEHNLGARLGLIEGRLERDPGESAPQLGDPCVRVAVAVARKTRYSDHRMVICDLTMARP